MENGGENPEAQLETKETSVAQTDDESSAQEFQSEESLNEMQARLEERIQQEVERRFQSAKDKRWAQLEKQYGELAELQKGRVVGRVDEAADAADSPLAEAKRLLDKAGLSNDPEAVRLLSEAKRGESKDLRILSDAAELALRRSNRKSASSGSVVLPSGGKPTRDLRSEYEQRLKRLRPGDVAGLSELKREFRRKGLDVY